MVHATRYKSVIKSRSIQVEFVNQTVDRPADKHGPLYRVEPQISNFISVELVENAELICIVSQVPQDDVTEKVAASGNNTAITVQGKQ